MKYPFIKNIAHARPLIQIKLIFTGKQPTIEKMFADAAREYAEAKK